MDHGKFFFRIVAALALSSSMSGCVIGVIRHGSQFVEEMGQRDTLLAQQKQSTWTQLSPQLRERCRAAAGPAVRRLGERPSVAFDEADAELTVPADFARSLALGRTRWTTLTQGRPADADYGVAWTREPVRSDAVLTAEQLTLRVRDVQGRVVAADTQFRLEWQGGLQPEFVRCATLDGPRRPKPDLTALLEVFGSPRR